MCVSLPPAPFLCPSSVPDRRQGVGNRPSERERNGAKLGAPGLGMWSIELRTLSLFLFWGLHTWVEKSKKARTRPMRQDPWSIEDGDSQSECDDNSAGMMGYTLVQEASSPCLGSFFPLLFLCAGRTMCSLSLVTIFYTHRFTTYESRLMVFGIVES